MYYIHVYKYIIYYFTIHLSLSKNEKFTTFRNNKNIHREFKDHQFQRGRLQFFPIRYTN